VAQQILCIIRAVQNKVTTFNFEGTELSLNPRVVRRGPADPVHHPRRPEQSDHFQLRGHRALTQPPVLRVHHNESRLRRPLRVARQLEGTLPHRGHDGARLRPDRRDLPLLLRLHGRALPLRQNRHRLQALLRAALLTIPLRLRHARRQIGM